MFKYLLPAVLLICGGCQTTPQRPAVSGAGFPLSEKLLVHVDRIIDTYEVTVQHAVLTGADRTDRSQWDIAGSSLASGYPGSWRSTPGLTEMTDEATRAVYHLNGENVEVAIRPGTHLIVKVLPDSQNSARIVGVYIQAEMTAAGLNIRSMPFDASTTVGQVLVLYQKDSPALQ